MCIVIIFQFFLTIALNLSFVPLMSPGLHLITSTTLELIVVTILPEFSFGFRTFFILQKYYFFTFPFFSKFLNLSAFSICKYFYSSPSSLFSMNSSFGSCIPSFFDIIPFHYKCCTLIPKSISISLLNICAVLTSVSISFSFCLYNFKTSMTRTQLNFC